MTLNAKIGGFMDFLAISGCDTSLSFTGWRHATLYAMADVYIYMAVNKMSNLIDFNHLQIVLLSVAYVKTPKFWP